MNQPLPVLQAGATETRYHRAGHGPPVLLLFPAGLADPLAARLFEALSASFRTVAPVVPPGVGGEVPFERWLGDLVDGLGLVRPSLVVDEPLAIAALGFALGERERVGAWVALGKDLGEPVEATPAMLLVPRLATSAAVVLPFLAGWAEVLAGC